MIAISGTGLEQGSPGAVRTTVVCVCCVVIFCHVVGGGILVLAANGLGHLRCGQ